MKQNNYKSIVYFIAATIVATITIQLYWNIQNYETNKQRLINEVQISLDNGVEAYYSDLAKTDFFAFVNNGSDSLEPQHEKNFWNRILGDSTFLEIEKKQDSLRVFTGIKGFTQIIDSGKAVTAMKPNQISMMSVFQGKEAIDSIQGLTELTSRIIVSITRDTIDFDKLDTLFNKELIRKGIAISYNLKHFDNDSVVIGFKGDEKRTFNLTTFSKSTYLPESQKLQLFFSNPTIAILKRSLTGIILSLLLSACIIACLLYLLHIIKQQKELAEIKNDLISNITHEFKTPIATVSTAIEGIKNFNVNNDKAKTSTYLDISEQQMKKLNLMVEKLLETATLDSDKLIIQKEEVDVVLMLRGLVNKYQMLAGDKKILFKSNEDSLNLKVDPFHFENAIANIIDNAVKYGGESIAVNLNSMLNSVEITIADNGGKIDKSQRVKIFDKFYRVPTGNRHDVKGFGIGLFYSKKIIDKHDGQLVLVPDPHNTIFKITL
ncbi:sensor histidine kinase [Maribacter sp. 2308TA10-17]|uniref:sensor histidine kinase n=1 Tax=Maribacter sp. 2308TA10-17 TaxID=3386276 RepID=UPI0039BD15C4